MSRMRDTVNEHRSKQQSKWDFWRAHLKSDHRGDAVALAKLHDADALRRATEGGDGAYRRTDNLSLLRDDDDFVILVVARKDFRADDFARLRGYIRSLNSRTAAT